MCSDGPELPSLGSTHPSSTWYGLVALNTFSDTEATAAPRPAFVYRYFGKRQREWVIQMAIVSQKWLIILHSCSCAPPLTRLMAFGWSLLQDRLRLAWVAVQMSISS
jgi:hypothetical protein